MTTVKIWTLKGLAKRVKQLQDDEDDALIVVSGNTGSGKSTFSLQLAMEVERLHGRSFNMKENMFFSKQTLLDAFERFPKGSTLLGDEAVNIFFNREFMNRWQKQLVKRLNMYRDKLFCIILVIPHFWSLDYALRSSFRIRWWVFNDKRGVAYLFQPDRQPAAFDPWNRRLNQELFSTWRSGEHANNDFIAAKSPNFVAKISYDKLPTGLEVEYKMLKMERRRLAAIEEEEEERMSKPASRRTIQQELQKRFEWLAGRIVNTSTTTGAGLVPVKLSDLAVAFNTTPEEARRIFRRFAGGGL